MGISHTVQGPAGDRCLSDGSKESCCPFSTQKHLAESCGVFEHTLESSEPVGIIN